MAEETSTQCLACGATSVSLNRRGALACENCGLEVVTAKEIFSGGPAAHRDACPWCANGTTHLVSTVGRTSRGFWEVYQCDGCAAQYASYVPAM
jgi:ribosomal protein L37AE/L43A